jgi:protein phosphatase
MAKTGESYTAALWHLRRAEEAVMSTYEMHPAGVTDTGNVRAVNEDVLLAEGDLVAVADGMGGHVGGEVASRVGIEALRDSFVDDTTLDGLVQAVHDANKAVWERAEAEPGLHGMGTTIVAVALVSDGGRKQLAVVNVGDSRAYLLHDGELSQLTRDHSLVADMVRAGAITAEDARTHPNRNVLTQVLGVDPDIEPAVMVTDPIRGDRILLCTDGLFDELTDDEIAALLAATSQAAEAADHLVQAAKDHGGHDNITAVVLDIA